MGVNTVVKDYGTAVLNAIRENDVKTLRRLMEKHLQSDHKIAALCVTDIRHKPSKKFACPLILAARQEDPSIIEYMMSIGVDPNFVHHTIYTTKRRETVTALHIAVDLGHYSTAEVLLNANADPNIPDHNNETCLHIATKKSDRIMTRMLLAKGADPTMTDHNGNAAIHIATLYGHLQLIKTLLKYDADVYQKGQYGAIPSHIAAREGHIHLVQVFCSRDAGIINIKIPCYADGREKASIHLAAENGHVETVQALLDQFSANVNIRDSDDNTPLHCVVMHRHHPYKMRDKDFFYATAKVLIKYRVAINEKNGQGETALHLAAANRYQNIVELLISVGANPFAENEKRLKPIDLVSESDPVTKQLLTSAMTNPRPPIHASALSLHKDFNNISLPPNFNSSAFMSGRLHSTSFPNQFLGNKHPLMLPGGDMSLANLSVRSHGSTVSSVFGGEAKTRQKSGRDRLGSSKLNSIEETKHKHENEIPNFSRSAKDRSSSIRSSKRESKRNRVTSYSDEDSQSSKNIRDMSGRGRNREEPTSSSRSRAKSVDAENLRRSERSKGDKRESSHHVRRKDQGTMNSSRSSYKRDLEKGNRERGKKRYEDDDDEYDDDDVKPSRDRVYENVGNKRRTDSHRADRQANGDKRRREEASSRKTRGKHDRSDERHYENIEDLNEDGIKVHTVPGKPSTIEVSYKGGPITISVDTQGEGSEEEEEDTYGELSSKKRVKSRSKSLPRASESKRGKSSRDDEDLMMMEMKRKQEEKLRRERVKAMERERERKMQEEMERQLRKQEEEEEQARRDEREKRRAKKLERKRGRQEQYEEYQKELDGTPTEELAVGKPMYVIEIPDEIKDENSFDSDEYEKEKLSKNTAARKRASLVAEGIRKRWSQDEDSVSSSGTKKPPRPAVPRDYSSSEAESTLPRVSAGPVDPHLNDTLLIRQEQPPAQKPSRRSGRKSAELLEPLEQQGERSSDIKPAPSAFVSDCKEIKVDKMETLFRYSSGVKSSDKSADGGAITVDTSEQILDYTREPRSPGSSTAEGQPSASQEVRQDQLETSAGKFDISNEELRFGLNMKVTGEAPKAYSKRDHAAARRAFMLHPPIGIESSSEASDSEFGSRLSLTESPGWDRSRDKKTDWSKKDPASVDKEYTTTGKRPLGGYAKPYRSFGEINPDTSALEEALRESEQHYEELKSPDASIDSTFTERDQAPVVLSTFASNASTEVKVSPESPKPAIASVRARELTADQSKQQFSTILSNHTKVSKQFQLGDEHLSKAPEQRRIHASDVLNDDDDSDDFDDSTFDDINEESSQEYDIYGRAKGKQSPAKTLDTSHGSTEMPVRDSNGLILPRKVTGTPTAFVSFPFPPQPPVQPQAPPPVQPKAPPPVQQSHADHVLKEKKASRGAEKSADKSGRDKRAGSMSNDSELEAYEAEPGARRARSKSRDKTITADDREVELINSRAAQKVIPVPRKREKVEKEEKKKPEEKTVREEKPTLKVSIGIPRANIASDVWEEAMSGSPLASSETFERSAPLDSGGLKFVASKNRTASSVQSDDYTDDDFEVSLRNRINNKKNKIKSRHYGQEVEAEEIKEELKPPERIVGRREQRKEKDVDVPKRDKKKKNKSFETTIDDDLVNEEVKKPRKNKYERGSERKHESKAIQLESGRSTPMLVDTLSDEDLLNDSRIEARERIGGILSQVRGSSRLSQSYDEDLNMLPDSIFQVPDIAPLSNFTGKYKHIKRTPKQAGKSGKDVPPDVLGVVQSDTEAGGRSHRGAGRSTRHPDLFHSEAEMSDLEPPMAPGPGMSMQQAALQSIHAGPVHRGYALPPIGLRVLRQPGHADKDFTFIRKLYRPPKKRNTSNKYLFAGAGRYGDSELTRRIERSGTDSDVETDQEELRRRIRQTGREKRIEAFRPPSVTEPGPVDFSKFNHSARLWMEQVDRKTVMKSKNMYLSVLPEGRDLPKELLGSKYSTTGSGEGDDGTSLPPQWVMARSRVLKASRGRLGTEGSGSERPMTPGRQVIIFFKIGFNWLDLAWVLFSGLQSDADTVRMIKDIQLKNPKGLADQLHDLMGRWWRKKGDDATMDELQRALDTVHMIYIQEELFDSQSFVPYSDGEDNLDLGEVSDTDPNVTRLMHEYEVRSLNASFNVEQPPTLPSELTPDVVLRSLQNAGVVPNQSATLLSQASRSRDVSRDTSMDRSMRTGPGMSMTEESLTRSKMFSSQDSLDRQDSGEDQRESPRQASPSKSSLNSSKVSKTKKKKPAVPPKKTQMKRETHL